MDNIIDLTAGTALVLTILSLCGPALIALINRPNWSDQVRRIVSLVVSVALALVGLLLTDSLHGDWSLPVIITAVVGLTKIAYDLLYKPTGLANGIEAVTGGPQRRNVSDNQV